MSAARHLRVVEVDDTSGEVTFLDSEGLARLEAELAKAKADLANAERDLRGKRAVIANLERDLVRQRLEHPDREFILRVCRYWHRRCRPDDYARATPRIDPASPDRFDAVARLAEMREMRVVDGKRRNGWKFEAEMFKAAIDGAAYDPFYTTLRNGKRKPQNDLEQIMRIVSKFEGFVERAPQVVGTFAGGDLEVPVVPGFTRPSQAELKRLARVRARRNNVREVPAAPSSGAFLGGQHGWCIVGPEGHCDPSRSAQERRTLLRHGVVAGHESLPASQT